MDYLLFQINLRLKSGETVPVLKLQLVDVSKLEVLRFFFLGFFHFESFFCFIAVDVYFSLCLIG